MARERSYRHDVRADTAAPIGCPKTDAHTVNKHVVGKCGAVNWNEGLHSMLRGKLNRLARRTNGCAKSVDMLVNLLALVFCAKLKLNTT